MKRGLQIAPENVQLKDPHIYLGFKMFEDNILSQKLTLRLVRLHTLNDI